MIYLKVHDTEKGRMIAMCDEELLGKVFKEGKLELNLDTYSEFYKGDLLREEEASTFINVDELHTANIVGKRSVGIVIKKGLVRNGQVAKISGVPFVHIYSID
jgi:hypothetical protein